MKIWTYCLAVACTLVLISASFGGAAMMTPPAEGEQGLAPLAKEPPSAVTSPQGQGSSPAAGEHPATGSEEAAPSAPSQQGPSSSPAASEQGTSPATTGQQATSAQGSSSPPAAGEHPATGQQAPSPQGASPSAAAQGATTSAAEPQSAYPATGAQQGSSSADVEGITPLTLKQSIGIALQKSPTLQSAQGAIKEAQYRRLGTVSDFLPQVNMQYSYTRLDKAPYFSAPPLIPATQIGTRDNYNWTTSVTQPVFTGGALINSYLLAKLGVDMAKVQFEQTKLDLVLQVREAYYSVLKAEKGVEVAQQAVQQLESHYTVAQAFFEVGIIAKNDVLQTEVQLAQRRQNLIKAENGLEVAWGVFNTLLRRGINEPVRLGETLEYTPMTIDMDALMEEAFRERPELKLSDLGIKSAKKEVGVAASKLFPQLSIVFSYAREGDEPSVNGSRFQHDADSWNVMGVAQWDIWDWGKAWWGVGESKARVFQAECALEQVKDAVRLDVQSASLGVTEARKNIQLAETAVSQAEENFRINEERYKGQVATSTDVLDALTLLTQARTNYYTALSDYNVAKARLQRAIGGM
jgi:outer membrane protein